MNSCLNHGDPVKACWKIRMVLLSIIPYAILQGFVLIVADLFQKIRYIRQIRSMDAPRPKKFTFDIGHYNVSKIAEFFA